MSLFTPVQKPTSKLARYRLLAPSASVRVSPLCLGGMNLGTSWGSFMGSMDKKAGFELLDAFYNAGGNFIDTAINYQSGESEQWIGEWMEQRGNRTEMVIATKCTTGYRYHEASKGGIFINTAGNSAKNIHESVKVSLKQLKTDYIDLLWIHWWDYTTSVEELMQALNILVSQGKVLYLGISDTPAWVVSKANEYARAHGLRPFSVYQGRWSAASRDFERDIIQMCRVEGMGICPWGALGGGNFRLPAEIEQMEKEGDKGRSWSKATEQDKSVTLKLAKVAEARGLSITGVALAYVCSKAPYVIPIVGGRKLKHLEDNIKAIGVVLTAEEIKEIESAYPFDIGFPGNFFSGKPGRGNVGIDSVAWLDWPGESQPISFEDE
ncbi:norsolorinic acid reductase [Drechslerella stenobrocha 248]|uniref:Norsolorinic acid reductase n=1 Tax=Drechslerella stenobrocha 248 TaxID=1043628 RepID=W7I5S5_9PEZI|nr:norsolorinic acid reductase [Drechslerella stenobrocha 248]